MKAFVYTLVVAWTLAAPALGAEEGPFRYLAWLCVRSGRRREALWHFARAAVRGQAPSVATDLAGLARNRLTVPTLGRSWPRERREWGTEAEAWLASLRS